MSTSKSRIRRNVGRAAASGSRAGAEARFEAPATVTRAALLDRGSDKRFRGFVYDLLTIATRMNAVREHLARRMKLSGPQYSVLMAVAQARGDGGVGVGALARLLHVSSAFVATETGKLAQAGLIAKRPNPKDRRGVLLDITRAGRALIEDNSAEIRAVNDEFFGQLDRASFETAASAIALIELGSRKAMHRVRVHALQASSAFQEAAE
ncbi:MAG: MarR family winged helix-turn-helix transcriptional regulator [Pseudorhodoplanes sp.]|uniref:MarR family winged helix-turn-helix transcriptional regulator n=1 Tax=Pseudorhodoplanes sp. TaxID=1934341 RepID=UPI003D1076D4